MTKKLMINNDDISDVSHDKQKFVSVIDNNELYFYNDVNTESALVVNKTLLLRKFIPRLVRGFYIPILAGFKMLALQISIQGSKLCADAAAFCGFDCCGGAAAC